MYRNALEPSNLEGAVRVVGLMSGTSLDGVDAALVRIEDGDPPEWHLEAFVTVPYTQAQRARILDVVEAGTPASVARLHGDLAEWWSVAVLAVCREAGVDPRDVRVVGSHGQTLWHAPPSSFVPGRPTGADPGGLATPGPAETPASPESNEEGPSRASVRGYTLQIGDPATLAERTGIAVASDFRSRDVAAGGEGAPLVPWVDRLLFAGAVPRVLVNIGGMANITRVPPVGSSVPLVAFDTGPGNAVLDAAASLATGGAAPFDRDGALARSGTPDRDLLERLLNDPYLKRTPPKSTGRERYGRAFVRALADDRAPASPQAWADLLATLTEWVARAIGRAVTTWAPAAGGEVYVTGGGAENPVLMEALASALEPVPVLHGRELGLDPAAKEAVAFAFLAWAHLMGRPANVPEATGAPPRVLGSYTPAGTAG